MALTITRSTILTVLDFSVDQSNSSEESFFSPVAQMLGVRPLKSFHFVFAQGELKLELVNDRGRLLVLHCPPRSSGQVLVRLVRLFCVLVV